MADKDPHLSKEQLEALTHTEDLLEHHTALPMTAPSRMMDAGLSVVGKAAAWLWLIVVFIIIWAVVGRYAFGQGSVTLEEWQWHLAGAAWLLGLAYTLSVDDHVRVDVIHERLSLRAQGWIELLGLVLLLIPFLLIGLWEAVPYAHSSFLQGEVSTAPAGLSNRWILKAVMALSFALLLVAAISRLMRVTALLFGLPRPLPARDAA